MPFTHAVRAHNNGWPFLGRLSPFFHPFEAFLRIFTRNPRELAIGGAEIPLSDLLNTGKIEGNEVINENDL